MNVRMWHATVSGGVIGLLVGIALQIGNEVQQSVRWSAIEEFAPWSPPQMMSLLKPEVIPVAVCVLVATLGSFVYVVWSRRQ